MVNNRGIDQCEGSLFETQDETEPLTAKSPKNVRQHTILQRIESISVERKLKQGWAEKLVGFCCSLIVTLTLLGFVNMLSIIAIVIGAEHFDPITYCPGEPNLAKVLIAEGILAIILSIFEGSVRVKNANREQKRWSSSSKEQKFDEDEDDIHNCWNSVLSSIRIGKIVLFIYLCVLVFRLYPNVRYEPYESSKTDETNYYCHPTLFLFSFWTILITFILVGTFLTSVCLCCCYAVSMAS